MEKKFSLEFMNVCLSNSGISIASQVIIPSNKISVIKSTNEPISFALRLRRLLYCLVGMIPSKEIHRILLSYIPEDNELMLDNFHVPTIVIRRGFTAPFCGSGFYSDAAQRLTPMTA
ncbi:hypothetical protein C5167_013821 [Papaver somniferum]|uniref:Uncharacterized protein n=1 Tax=Papaver somniferum TaxID=3469 RepID=A0A4Y7J1F9_PAPSO|nr:hypothetical protein C5167_013821 [Papaver somniferum]